MSNRFVKGTKPVAGRMISGTPFARIGFRKADGVCADIKHHNVFFPHDSGVPTTPYPQPKSRIFCPYSGFAAESMARVPLSIFLGEKHLSSVSKIRLLPRMISLMIYFITASSLRSCNIKPRSLQKSRSETRLLDATGLTQ